jgi:hypothetical protein
MPRNARNSIVLDTSPVRPWQPSGRVEYRRQAGPPSVGPAGSMERASIDVRIHGQVDNRIVANPAGDFTHVWSNCAIGRGEAWVVPEGGFTLNSNCWAAGINFHGVGSAVRGQYYYGATLVSPRHFVTARHCYVDTGTVIHYIRPDGSVYEATAAAVALRIAGWDFAVGYLTEPVPSDVPFYPVLPYDYDDYLTLDPTDLTETNDAGHAYPTFPTEAQSSGLSGKPVIRVLKEREATIGRILRSSISGAVLSYYPTTPKYPDREDYWMELGINGAGDSGWPSFVLIDGELVLLAVHWHMYGAERPVVTRLSEINAHMAALHGSTQYQLTEVGLG